MKFRPVFYIISGWPSIEKTKQMVDKYVEHGVSALQFDMPSANPSRESEFIQERMRHARDLYGERYDVYMDMLREVRMKYLNLEIHLVLYPDVIETIGLEKFADFCNEIGIYSVLVMEPEMMKYLNGRGIATAAFIGYDTSENAIRLAKANDNQIVFLSNKNGRTQPRDGLVTWAERIKYIREAGVKAPVFGVTGISSAEELAEVKHAGADGAYIGTIMMKLWDDEPELWRKLDAFEEAAK